MTFKPDDKELDTCAEIIARARLAGVAIDAGNVVDLLADNTTWPLEHCRAVAIELKFKVKTEIELAAANRKSLAGSVASRVFGVYPTVHIQAGVLMDADWHKRFMNDDGSAPLANIHVNRDDITGALFLLVFSNDGAGNGLPIMRIDLE